MEVKYQNPTTGDPETTECGNFKEGNHGLALYQGPRQSKTVGYVPLENLIAIIPDEDGE